MDNLVLSQVPWDIFAAVFVIVAGILFIVFSLGMMLGERRAQGIPNRRERGRRAGDTGPGEASFNATRAVEEAAARAIQDLEAKASAAARLLDEAEARIVRLREVLAALEREAEEREGSGSGLRPAMAGAPLRPEACQLDAGLVGVTTGADATDAEAGAGVGAAAGVPGVSEKHALVFRLADQGLSVPEIARRAGIGRGEAQLILDLRGKDQRTGLNESPAIARGK